MKGFLVHRNGDEPAYSLWFFFDVPSEAEKAREHVKKHNAIIKAEQDVDHVPAGDFVSDAEELRAWLTFEY